MAKLLLYWKISKLLRKLLRTKYPAHVERSTGHKDALGILNLDVQQLTLDSSLQQRYEGGDAGRGHRVVAKLNALP